MSSSIFIYRTKEVGRIVPGSATSSKYGGRHLSSNAEPVSAPYMLRSMQVIADSLLLVSFYRTASQLR